ncbi:unnamed protein product [Cylicocyclus nassatus]|uniref:Uncharacterized protein n=1 Tax=Cylicocyclus nassatus TaxID=53992 RepID=A0AA36GQQ2_CYLNA|nr:unnamed protein product [Cylicocyclus nassatus]
MFSTPERCDRATSECATTRRLSENMRTGQVSTVSNSCPGVTGSSEHSEVAQQSSLGLPVSSLLPHDSQYEPCARRDREARKRRWLACELLQLDHLVKRFRRNDGRIQWAPLAAAWECSNDSEGRPLQRTVPALKAAYAKLVKRSAVARIPPTQPETEEVPEHAEEGEIQTRTGTMEIDGVPEQGTSRPTAETVETSEQPDLRTLVFRKFRRFHHLARSSPNRAPIRKPLGEIPQALLEIGSRILAQHVPDMNSKGFKYLTRLNAAVYAIGRAIVAVADSLEEGTENPRRALKDAEEIRHTLIATISTLVNNLAERKRRVRRKQPWYPTRAFLSLVRIYKLRKRCDTYALVRELKDRLRHTQSDIQVLKNALRRRKIRRGGYPAVIRSSSNPTVEIPAEAVRDYWENIVGRRKPFEVSYELKQWARGGMCSAPSSPGRLQALMAFPVSSGSIFLQQGMA